MEIFVFISDAWGYVSGGINCFNYNLAIACAKIAKNNKKIKVCCVVPELSDIDKKNMEREKIVPITISKNAFESPEAIGLISQSIKSNKIFHHYYPNKCNTFYIGHDVYTGHLSKGLASNCGGWNIVFHHMDYASYYLFNKPNVTNYSNKTHQQEIVLRDADMICAVGPMLLQSAQDIARGNLNDKIIEVFPGFESFDPLPTTPNKFQPIVFGRVEKNNQIIKQIPLSIDAFAKAVAGDKITPVIRNNPTLYVIGYDVTSSDSLKSEIERLQKNAAEIAGSVCNIVPLPYTTDRTELKKRLRSASASMMLSFHEGFGLVGYESIAAGIPLILSKNTGLYMFLKREKLDHLVYSVEIEGAIEPKTYSDNDLNLVSKALRDIRQNEKAYKEKAMELHELLNSNKDKYSWEAVANKFIFNVLKKFEDELKNESVVFFNPDDVIQLNYDLKDRNYDEISINLSSKDHVFIVEGKNALASLISFLQKKYKETYTHYIYNVHNEDSSNSAYIDFLNDCRCFFGKECDYEGQEFMYVLGERLNGTILIFDNFPMELFSHYEKLFSLLNKDKNDFYVFVIFNTNSSIIINPYNNKTIPKYEETTNDAKSISEKLTYEQKIIAKILAFRKEMGYSKKLINYICRGLSYYNMHKNYSLFENSEEIEEKLKEIGLIEEYSKYSYQNAKNFIPAMEMIGININDENYAFGIYELGRFYTRCYYLCRDPQLIWGYFSCNCFSYAIKLNKNIKEEIKGYYELILTSLRKQAMNTSDYERYINVIQEFINEYGRPNNSWLWYSLIHCESIYSPCKSTLEKVNDVLELEFPDKNKDNRKGNDLYVQLIRLCAELEDSLNINDSLNNLLYRIADLAENNQFSTAWSQCFSTIVTIATNQKNYNLAEKYLNKYRETSKHKEYSKMIAIALEVNLKIAEHFDGYLIDLNKGLSDIKKALKIAANTLRDYRAQGWITGLLGECQILLNNAGGEKNLQQSIINRRTSGEKTNTYKKWLERILKYRLQPKTLSLINEEIDRINYNQI